MYETTNIYENIKTDPFSSRIFKFSCANCFISHTSPNEIKANRKLFAQTDF